MVGSTRNEKPSYLFQIGVHKSYEGQESLGVVRVGQIAYAFLGSAVRQHLIHAPWIRQQRLRDKAVYLQTTEAEIYRTECRTIQELGALLNPHIFAPIHRSLLVNMAKIRNLDVKGKVKQIDVEVKGGTESLRTSRRHLRSLRARLGLRSRRRLALPRDGSPGDGSTPS